MTRRNLGWPLGLLLVGVLAFWTGMEFNAMRYNGICLDIGGRSNPGNYPICVVERPAGGVQLGTFWLFSDDVVELSSREGAQQTIDTLIALKEPASRALADYTKQHID